MSILHRCQEGGLRLMARRLRFGPAPGELVAWSEVLADDLLADGFMDGADDDLLARALEEVGRRQSEWPTSSEVLAECRSLRKRRRAGQMALPGPRLSDEQRELGRRRMAALMRTVRGRMDGSAMSLDDIADNLEGR
jgi:hypothetical protein